MIDKYSLKFTLDTARSSELIEGLLQLLKNGEELNAYRATSSLAGRQTDSSWDHRGGLIPPGEHYLVAGKPIYMPDVKGVEGNFYPITPYSIETDGDTRGDFGIHFDANVPGSLGCIVLRTARGWEAFQRDIANTKLNQIPLVVEYK